VTFAFESIEELCKWLRLFVSVLGGRDWIAQLIPQSEARWKVESAVGYVTTPYDPQWPEKLEHWPWLWCTFRSCFLLNFENEEMEATLDQAQCAPIQVLKKEPSQKFIENTNDKLKIRKKSISEFTRSIMQQG